MHFVRVGFLNFLLVFLFISGCSNEEPRLDTAADQAATPAPTYVDTGDLPDLAKRQHIRLLIPSWDANQALPRQGLSMQVYRDIAEAFVVAQGLTPQWILVEGFDQLIPSLLAGRGDIIVANLAQTASREKQLAFTLPLTQAKEYVITTKHAPPLTTLQDLAGKTVAVSAGSSFQESLQHIAEENPALNFSIKPLHDIADPDKLLERLNAGEFTASVLDDNIAAALSSYRDDFRLSLPISDLRNIAWAVRPSAKQLLAQLNLFITQTLTTRNRQQRHQEDFSEIKARKKLRMITRNAPTSYFLWRGELMGFEYDLVTAFAKQHQLKLEVVVAPPDADMIQWLKDGRGDLIAAGMTILPERQQRGIAFTRPYNHIGEQLVTHKTKPPLAALTDLNGRTLVVKPNTAYWHTAKQWLQQGHQFTLQASSETTSTEELLAEVAQGNIDATLADSHLVAIEQTFHTNLSSGFTQQPLRPHGWAVRQENPELLTALNQFLKQQYRGLFFNITYQKYFKNQRRIAKYQGQRLSDSDALSPYDDAIKQLTPASYLDWRLVVAQMYQESRFDPKARSSAGAQGLLQVMPRTAREMGFALPLKEHDGIRAGVQYMGWVRNRFEQTLPLEQSLWFTLAAYNAGYGHVYDARRLAKRKGWDPNIWFDNVENAMLLLSKREYFRNARFGYVRGREPVNYVRKIRNRYHAYLAL